ncbi:MAG: MFS transporter [Alphaproteobacteria bacterium]|nr:MFS transporter [Alphaproteobacteria bacterium]
MPSTESRNHTPALLAMLGGNFLIGTGVLLPSGLLNQIAADYAISSSEAGRLALVGALVVGIGAPLLATATGWLERRSLLAASLLVYALGHFWSFLAPGFEMQQWARAFTVIGAALFTPQAAATLGVMLPPERRAAMIAFIFIGWSAANVAGIPLAGVLAEPLGWRPVYAVMALLSLVGALAVWLTVPKNLFVQRIGAAAWAKALGSPLLLTVFAVTLCSMAGQFTMFSYIAPLLRDGFGATPHMIALMFLVVGSAGIAGNSIATRIVGRFGVDSVIAAGLMALALGFLGLFVFFGNYRLGLAAGLFWGLGSFSSNSLQQSRLAQLSPAIASVTIALNTSFVYLGQSAGAKIGGLLMDAGVAQRLPLMSLGFLVAATLLSLLATRLGKSLNPAPSPAPARR